MRGIYAREDETTPWMVEERFENGVPRFESKAECLEFIRAHCADREHPSNPDRTQARAPRAPPRTERARASRGGVPVDDRVPLTAKTQAHLTHIFTMLVTWNQVEERLLAARREYDVRWPPRALGGARELARLLAENRFFDGDDDGDGGGGDDGGGDAAAAAARSAAQRTLPHCRAPVPVGLVDAELRARLALPVHRVLSPDSTEATLRYLWHHMRSGVYVLIRAGRLAMFAPFVNGARYRNVWGDVLRVRDGLDMAAYYAHKMQAEGCKEENFLPDKREWWANGNIICNEHCKRADLRAAGGATERATQWWGDQFLAPLKDMLAEACRLRAMPDCELFLNKRDYPQLKVHQPPDDDGAAGARAPAVAVEV